MRCADNLFRDFQLSVSSVTQNWGAMLRNCRVYVAVIAMATFYGVVISSTKLYLAYSRNLGESATRNTT